MTDRERRKAAAGIAALMILVSIVAAMVASSVAVGVAFGAPWGWVAVTAWAVISVLALSVVLKIELEKAGRDDG